MRAPTNSSLFLGPVSDRPATDPTPMHRIHPFSSLLAVLIAVLLFAAGAHAAEPLPSPPAVSADSYILMDHHSGQVLAQKNPDERMDPASITKLMTAYVVFAEMKAGRLPLDTRVVISEHAWRMPGSRTFVEVGTKVPVSTLVQGMIVQSGNDATVALAEKVAGSEATFASLMNQQAKRLGMNDTHFVNSTGWPDPDHYSTARDIAKLTRALIDDFPEYYKYYAEREFAYNGISQYNRNKLLWRDQSVDGVKTGHTDAAGYCLVASAQREQMRLISVVLKDRSEEARAASSQALLNYGFRFFETRKLYAAGEPLKEARIWKGEQDLLPLGLYHDLYATFPRGQYDQLRASANFQPEIVAPAKQGEDFGTLNVSLNGAVVAERKLVALRNIAEGSWWQRLLDSILMWFQS